MPSRPLADNQNLDSLLDTVANVVGILVVLMAVTQISVGEAMKRIRIHETIQASALDRRQQELDARAAALVPPGSSVTAESSILRDFLSQLENAPAAGPDSSFEDAHEERRRVRALEREVEARRSQLVSLQLELRDSPARPDQARRVQRLPDPRPAPPGARRFDLLCRNGRIVPANLQQLEQQLMAEIERSPGTHSQRNPIDPYQIPELVDHFRVVDVGNADLRWSLAARRSGALIARLSWRRPDVGDDRADLERAGSRFGRALSERAPASHYLRFHVWSDSFEVYLAARRLAEEAGFSVGWIPIEAETELEWRFVSGRPPEPPIPVD